MLRRLFTSVLLLIACVPAAHADKLWVLESRAPEKLAGPDRSVAFDYERLRSWQVGSSVELPIPSQGNVDATLRKRRDNAGDSTTLWADLGHSSDEGVLILSFDASQVIAHIEYANTSYKLEASGALGKLRKPRQHKVHEEEVQFVDAKRIKHRVDAKAEKSTADAIRSDEVVVLNILIAYSKAAAINYDGNVKVRIAQIEAVANQYLKASGVLIQVNFVHTVEIDYPEEEESLVGSRIRGAEAPWFADIHNLRYEHGADVVAYLSARGGGKSGLCGWDGSVAGCEHSRYIRVSLEETNDADITFAHELGHALGLNHSRRQGDIGASFPFALGYLQADGAGTIMSYFTSPIRRYSQSQWVHGNGALMGVPREYKNGADAVYALNAVRFEAGEAYEPNPDLTHAADMLETHGHMALAQCVREGKSKYAAIIYELDCSNKDLTSLAGLELLPNLERLDLSHNLLDDLSDFPELEHLQVLNLNHNYITDIAPLVQLSSLIDLQLVGNRITQLPDFSPMEAQLGHRSDILLDLRDNRLEDIAALVESRERQGITLDYKLEGNDSIDCWQKRYLLEYYWYVHLDDDPSDINIEDMQNPEPCDTSDDNGDYNGNGIGNMEEVEEGASPFSRAFSSELRFSQNEYFVEEDSGVVRIEIQRTGEDLSGDVEFKLATLQESVSERVGEEWRGHHPARRHLDYIPVNRSYVVSEGNASVEIDIELIDDPWYYGAIEFPLKLYASKGANLVSNNTATVIIEDDERHTMDTYSEPEADTSHGGSAQDSAESGSATPSSGSGGGGLVQPLFLLLLVLAAMGSGHHRRSPKVKCHTC